MENAIGVAFVVTFTVCFIWMIVYEKSVDKPHNP